MSGRAAADLEALAAAVVSCAAATKAPLAADAGRVVPDGPGGSRQFRTAMSDLHRMAYLRGAGKLGGTSIFKGAILPGLCAVHPDFNDGSGKREKLFGGAQVPKGCLKALEDSRMLYYAERPGPERAEPERVDAATPFAFTFLRAPDERFVSIYDYVVGHARKQQKSAAKYKGRRLPSFAEALANTSTMMNLGANSGHWAQQLPWIVETGWLPYVDYAGRVNSISSELPVVIERINAAAAQGPSPPPSLPVPVLEKMSLNVKKKNTCDFDCRAMKAGLSVDKARKLLAASFPVDVAFLASTAEVAAREEDGSDQGRDALAELRAAPPEATPELMQCILHRSRPRRSQGQAWQNTFHG